MAQADQTKFRWLGLAAASSRGASPADGVTGDKPDFVMTPETVSGMPTTGFLLMLKAPTTAVPATAGAGGFTITMWLRDPVTLRWAAFSGISVSYDQLFTTFDIDAGQLFVQIGNIAVDGAIDVGIAEQ